MSKQATMIKLDDGKVVNRDKVLFLLTPSPTNPQMLNASDRSYLVGQDGSYRRLGTKLTRDERKEMKKERREGE